MPLEIYPEMTSNEAKEDRHHLRVWIGRVAVLLALLGVTAWATGAYAESPVLIAHSGVPGDYVKIYDRPCTSQEVIDVLNPERVPEMKEALMRYQGKDYKACWTVRGTNVVIVDEAADVTPIERRAFKVEGV